MNITDKKVAIVGLGVMGGSIMKALLKKGVDVSVCDTDRVLIKRVSDKYYVRAHTDPMRAIALADITVVCLYPGDTVKFIREYAMDFKPGSVVTDVCGIKRPMVNELAGLKSNARYVSAHPMAGTEGKGFDKARSDLYEGCNYIIVRYPGIDEEAVKTTAKLAGLLGVGKIIYSDPSEHDGLIAYTSQLPHAIALAYAAAMNGRDVLDYSAGSFRDVSRVADINARMWAELFAGNADMLLRELSSFIANLEEIRGLVKEGDMAKIGRYMEENGIKQ